MTMAFSRESLTGQEAKVPGPAAQRPRGRLACPVLATENRTGNNLLQG